MRQRWHQNTFTSRKAPLLYVFSLPSLLFSHSRSNSARWRNEPRNAARMNSHMCWMRSDLCRGGGGEDEEMVNMDVDADLWTGFDRQAFLKEVLGGEFGSFSWT